MDLGCAIKIAEKGAAADYSGLSFRVDLNLTDRGQVDHESLLRHSLARRVVPAAAH